MQQWAAAAVAVDTAKPLPSIVRPDRAARGASRSVRASRRRGQVIALMTCGIGFQAVTPAMAIRHQDVSPAIAVIAGAGRAGLSGLSRRLVLAGGSLAGLLVFRRRLSPGSASVLDLADAGSAWAKAQLTAHPGNPLSLRDMASGAARWLLS